MSRTWPEILREHARVIDALADQAPALDRIAAAIIDGLRAGRRVYTFGNGGSAADAQHIAAELLGRFRLDRPALPAMALTTDSSTLTAIANDLGYETVFARQIEGLVQPGDIAWGLSTSGASPNVLAGLHAAHQRDGVTIGFTGSGSAADKMAELCTHTFRAPHDRSDRIQEAHVLAYHYVCERVEAALAR